MRDLKSRRWIIFKAWLFLASGVMAAAGVLIESPNIRTLMLLGIALWSFCRLYYFAFYVIERYLDPTFRFAGIGSAVTYLVRGRRG